MWRILSSGASSPSSSQGKMMRFTEPDGAFFFHTTAQHYSLSSAT